MDLEVLEMKVLPRSRLLFLSLALLCLPAAAAEPIFIEPQTVLEKYLSKQHSVIIQGFSDVGSIDGQFDAAVNVQTIEIIEAATGQKAYGVCLGVKGAVVGEERHVERSLSYIDYEELDSFIKALDYLLALDKNVTKLNGYQALYKTKGSVTVTNLNAGGQNLFLLKSGVIDSVEATMTPADCARLRKYVADAKTTLDGLKK